MKNELLLKAELLQNTLISHATNDSLETGDYNQLREDLLSIKPISKLVPEYVKSCRDLNQFWQFIKRKFQHYAERREFIYESFIELLAYIEDTTRNPFDGPMSTFIERLGVDYINEQWRKALERRIQDPEGAITTARTLLESVCKYILEKQEVAYEEKWDLPKLYFSTAEVLNLAPQQHSEDIFKQILGGCQTIINNLGLLRNKTGDAHGKGIRHVKPSERHAKLAVNLAGTMSVFLIETYEFRKESIKKEIDHNKP